MLRRASRRRAASMTSRRPRLVGGQEHQHVGVLAEPLAVLLEDVGDERLGFRRQPVLGRPLVQVEDHQAEPWFVGHVSVFFG